MTACQQWWRSRTPISPQISGSAATATPPFSGLVVRQLAVPAVVAGDLLLCQFALDLGIEQGDFTAPGEWNLLTKAVSASLVRVGWYWKIAPASAGATTTAFSVGESNGGSVGLVWRIAAGTFHAATAPATSTAALGTSTAPRATVASAPWGTGSQTLWITSYGANNQSALLGYPAEFPNNRMIVISGGAGPSGTGDVSLATAARISAAGSEYPSAFSTDIGTDGWVALTIAIRPTQP